MESIDRSLDELQVLRLRPDDLLEKTGRSSRPVDRSGLYRLGASPLYSRRFRLPRSKSTARASNLGSQKRRKRVRTGGR
jgi:hypothetical protein